MAHYEPENEEVVSTEWILPVLPSPPSPLPASFLANLHAASIPVKNITVDINSATGLYVFVYNGPSPHGIPYVVSTGAPRSLRITGWQCWIAFGGTVTASGIVYISAANRGGPAFSGAGSGFPSIFPPPR